MFNQKLKTLMILVALINSTPLFADSARLLRKNNEAMHARADLISQAKELITIEYFTVDDDDLSIGGLSILREAARNGVKVKILVDGLSQKMSKAVIASLSKEANFEIKFYNPFNPLKPHQWLSRLHDKSLCVDGKICITGGRNISNKYFLDVKGTRYNDLDVIFNGQAAKNAQDYFLRLWENPASVYPQLYAFSKDSLAEDACRYAHDNQNSCESQRQQALEDVKKSELRLDDAFVDLITGRAGFLPEKNSDWLAGFDLGSEITFLNDDPETEKNTSGISLALYQIIKERTRNNLLIVSPYVVLSDRAYSLIKFLREKNIPIKIITNSLNSSDNVVAQTAYADSKKKLIEAGVEIWEYKGPDTIHAKAAVIDDERVLIGSYNFDLLSRQKNREVGITFINQKFAQELTSIITNDFQSHAYLIGKDLKPTNDDGNYDKAATWKKLGVGFIKLFDFTFDGMAKKE